MSNTNNYCLEFLLTTYDFTIATETIQFSHIIVQMVIHKEIMKFRLKFLTCITCIFSGRLLMSVRIIVRI